MKDLKITEHPFKNFSNKCPIVGLLRPLFTGSNLQQTNCVLFSCRSLEIFTDFQDQSLYKENGI